MKHINPFDFIDDINIKGGQSKSMVTLVPKNNVDLLTVAFLACNIQRAFVNLPVMFDFNGVEIVVDTNATMTEITARYKEVIRQKHALRRSSSQALCRNNPAV